MNCKNCKQSLKQDDHFCPNCGAKIVTDRLTFRRFFHEIILTYFAWDNTLFLTFWHLLTKPEKVINGFINGVRKKYMHPIHFMIVSLTFYGIYLYFAKDSLNEIIDNYNLLQRENSSEAAEKFMTIMTKYFNLITFLSIPIYAFTSYLVFKKFKYNFIEHNVIYIYANAQYNFIAVLLSIIGFMDSSGIMISQTLLVLITFIYYPYLFKKLFNLNLKQTIWKSIIYIILFGFIALILIIIGVSIFIYFEKKHQLF